MLDRLLQESGQSHVASDGQSGDRVQYALPDADAFRAGRQRATSHIRHAVGQDAVLQHVGDQADDRHAREHLVEASQQGIADRQVQEILNERAAPRVVFVRRDDAAFCLELEQRIVRAVGIGVRRACQLLSQERPNEGAARARGANDLGDLHSDGHLCQHDRDRQHHQGSHELQHVKNGELLLQVVPACVRAIHGFALKCLTHPTRGRIATRDAHHAMRIPVRELTQECQVNIGDVGVAGGNRASQRRTGREPGNIDQARGLLQCRGARLVGPTFNKGQLTEGEQCDEQFHGRQVRRQGVGVPAVGPVVLQPDDSGGHLSPDEGRHLHQDRDDQGAPVGQPHVAIVAHSLVYEGDAHDHPSEKQQVQNNGAGRQGLVQRPQLGAVQFLVVRRQGDGLVVVPVLHAPTLLQSVRPPLELLIERGNPPDENHRIYDLGPRRPS
mmetsp:Transcript_31786/g.92875  ORF Transcript_31786/g.92875 Transcript_31786/m.92875 type:complete len:441 (-) Transcript_31786:952-2274(-)